MAGLIGKNPQTSDLWQGYATFAISNYFIARMLPREWRKFYLGGWTVGHSIATINNCMELGKRDDPCL